MALTDNDVQAQIDAAANAQSPDEQKAAEGTFAPKEGAPQPVTSQFAAPAPAVVTPTFLDSVISHADSLRTHFGHVLDAMQNDPIVGNTIRAGRDVAAGAITGAADTADSAKSFLGASARGLAAAEDPEHADAALAGATEPDPFTPVYEHARGIATDVRDAIAVKDPGIADNLLNGVGQFLPSFMGFSRILGGIGGLANLWKDGNMAQKAAGALARFVPADTATMATAQGPHDPRLADTFQLLRNSEGQFGDILRRLAPNGGALNAYINYLADRTNESEATGRFKNVLDSYGASALITGALHGAGTVFKQGWNALHFMADNGMGSMSDIMPKPQEGAVGYHGSPVSNIEKFDPEALGKDENSAAFGHGLYVADSPDVANPYAGIDGTMYKVHVPDEHMASMIDWDKPLSEQPESVRAALEQPAVKTLWAGSGKYNPDKVLGGDIMEALGKTKQTSKLLDTLGVRGVRYPASGKYSQGGDDSRVSVLFDPGNAAIKGRMKSKAAIVLPIDKGKAGMGRGG